MIPKVIHYCWFGGKKLPALAQKCIKSWRKYLPDYEIKEWNETNFDVNIIPYTKEAYAEKKYAFVSDYARFWILYHYGGLYFDTDVEIIKPIDDIIARGSFMGCEKNSNEFSVNPGLGLGAEAGMVFYKEIIQLYNTLHFCNPDGSLNLTTIVTYTSNLLAIYGMEKKDVIQCVDNIWIYPKEYFAPMDPVCSNILITDNTRSIHHYSASWLTKKKRFIKIIKRLIGYRTAAKFRQILVKYRILKQ